jgi:hypothetical protein
MPLTITLDGNQFTFSNQALEAIATTFWRTRVKERGRMLCGEREVTAGPEHIGGPGSITARNCRGIPEAGYFHTHATGSSAPSWWDAFAILSDSYRHKKPSLGCRGAKEDGLIRCETAKRLPTITELQYLKTKRHKMGGSWAHSDPEIAKYLSESYSFEARKVPELIKPPAAPPVAPRIKVEELVFAQSRFTRYTNLDTGEVQIKQVY